MSRWDGLIINARVATLREERGAYGLVEDGAVGWRGEHLAYVGRRADLPKAESKLAATVIDAAGGLLTPGLIDAHTHLVFAGDRAQEFERRLQGATYAEIAAEGGGILSTVRATRAASEDELLRQSLPRARALLADGATGLEIKSGYGLDLDGERKMLRVATRVGVTLGVPVRRSFLGAHALPPEFAGCADDYIDEVCGWMTRLHSERLVDAVDAFCETIAFDGDQVRRLFQHAQSLDLPVKLHADQLSDGDGAALAAGFAGLSADHLEYTSRDGVRAMATAGTVAMLLPAAFHFLRETTLPPIDLFREYGVPMAVASDCNPGTSPLLSVREAMALACTCFRITPEEALLGATRHAARALGWDDRGELHEGLRADLALWRVGHPSELSYWSGAGLLRRSWCGGKELKHLQDPP